MSQLSDFFHKIKIDLQGGISLPTAIQIWADIKAEREVVKADVDAFATYVVKNAAVEEGILTELIALGPVLGIPAVGIVALEAALVAVKAIVASQAVGNDSVHAIVDGFATLNKSWAERTLQVLKALGIE